MNAVIAAIVNVGRWRSACSSATAGSKRWKRTSGIGTSIAIAAWPIRPVMWNSGAAPRTLSSAPRRIQSR
jgi:hypothetical protein